MILRLILALALISAGAARADDYVNGVRVTLPEAHKWMTGLSDGGVFSVAQPGVADLSGLGTGVAAALAAATNTVGGAAVIGGTDGIDLSGLTISNCRFKSSGFCVNGSATITANAFGANSANQSLSISPVWNTPTTLASGNVQATTASTTVREFLVNVGLISNKGTGTSPATSGAADKVTLAWGILCNTGSIACWAGNSLTTINGPLSSDFWASNIHEFDTNNMSGTDIGVYTGAFNPARSCEGTSGVACWVGGLLVTGIGTNTLDYGMAVAGVITGAGGPMFNRGFVVHAAKQHAFEDVSNSQTSIALYGSHTNNGIDMHLAAFGSHAIYLANNQVIAARNVGNSADIVIAKVSNTDSLYLGTGGAWVVMDSTSGVLSRGNNLVDFGATSNRWANIFGVNGDFSGAIKASGLTTGTPTASVCLDADGNMIKKTTAGSCV